MRLRWIFVLCFAVWAGAQAAPAAPPPVSAEETALIKQLSTAYNDPATTPTRMDGVIADFRQHFPTSRYTEAVLLLGVRYHSRHSDYLEMLDYGTRVLAIDPHNLYTLSALGAAIPDNVKSSDLDSDQRLTQAEGYDRQVILIASGILVTGGAVEFEGKSYTPEQAKNLKDSLESPAYLSLGRIAAQRRQYPAAVAAFQQALTFIPVATRQSEVYYDIGVAEAAQQHVTEAQAAFTKALQLNPTSDLLQKMVKAEQAKLGN